MSAWTDHVDRWKDCQLCPLGKQRDRICLGRGVVPCDVVFLGEAPGPSEDATGQVFYGPAGDLLDKIIERAFEPWQVPGTVGQGYNSIRYSLNNLVACFPREAKGRGDNEPDSSEIRACEPRLIEFINLARPRLIVCVGSLASSWVDHNDVVKCVDIRHPAFILRMPLSQRQMEIQRATVVIARATEVVMAQPAPEWKEWTNGGHREAEQRLTVNYGKIAF